MKKCSMCKQTKNFEEFHKSVTNLGGYANYCKQCHSEYSKKKYDDKRVHPKKIKNGLIHCRRCDQYLDKEMFPQRRIGKYETTTYCKSCWTHIGHTHNMKRLGISVEQYVGMEKDQNYKCKICGGKDSKRLSVDHDHSCCSSYPGCGKCIRGLLCSRCNKALGMVNDDIVLLQKMIKYLSD
jgi:hypothetical protein